MKFSLKSLNGLVLASLLATVGASAMAEGQTTTPATSGYGTGQQTSPNNNSMMRHHDPVKMQAWMAKRQAELKATLKITPAQEGAWTTFTAAMQPPARMDEHHTPGQRAEFGNLSTPERIDKMRVVRSQRMTDMNAAMDKRGEATKTFYAALSPEQQKTFDAEHLKMGQRHGRGHHDGGTEMQRKG